MKMDTADSLSFTSRLLHWFIALVIIGLVITGVYMESNEAWALYPWHKSIGMLILLPIILRVLWRIKNGLPASIAAVKHAWEKPLAKSVHLALLLLTVVMPVSGMMMSGLGGYGLDIFGLQVMAANPDPANPGQMIPYNETLSGAAHYVHATAGTVLMVLVSLHIIAALKHHFMDRDDVLKRMLGKS